MSELKACPFCCGAAGLCKDDDGRWTQVECLSCGARSNEWPGDEAAPIAAWNRRAPLPTVMIADADGSIRPLLPEVTREEIYTEICDAGGDWCDFDRSAAADALIAMLREKGVIV